MSRTRTHGSLGRCILVWLSVSALCAGVLTVVAGRLPQRVSLQPTQLDATPFDDLLATGSAIALAACACWFWLITSLVLLEAMTGLRVWRRGCPDAVRRAVLTLCGAALVAGSATQGPALADTTAGLPPTQTTAEQRSLAGLRLPERPVAGMVIRSAARPPTSAASTQETSDRHRIQPGDTLWDLSERHLPAHSSAVEVARGWREIWEANREVIGPDPDLIHPGGVLRLPDLKEHR